MTESQAGSRAKIGRAAAIVAALGVAFWLGGMWLGGDRRTEPAANTPAVAEEWTCSMHPQVRSPEPGACPICGMDLIPVSKADGDAQAQNRIALSQSARLRAKIRTTPVKRLHAGRFERRLLGRVDYDETRLRTVTSWIEGRIDRLHVRTTGEKVQRGQVIATLYSPEVLRAHQDLLLAKQQIQKLRGATEGARMGAEAALEASRERLRLLGVPADEVAAMEQASRPSEQIRIRSPFSGTVIERLATEGAYVKTGTGLYQIADLSRLWVQLDAYESDLPVLQIGQEVSLKVEALPTEEFSGRVTFVDPILNQRTRTTRVRIEVKNPKGQLRPNMFAEAVVRGSSSTASGEDDALVIPETAPLFTGRRSVVYVEIPGMASPTYEARVVRLGPKMGEVYPVIAGVREGERVVVNGAFTLDADLQIRGGDSMMSAPDDSEDGPYDRVVAVPPALMEPLSMVVQHYLAIHEALAGDDLKTAIVAATALGKSASAIDPASPAEFRDAWLPLRRLLVTHAELLAAAKSLDEARLPFRDVSQHIATLLRVFGNPGKDTVHLAFCPMALEGEGAEWVQRSSSIENPYFGASMHSCGEVHEVVEHGTYLPLRGSAKSSKADAGEHHH